MTDFIKAHLGIDSKLIKFEDVESFFSNDQLEKATLEFKSFSASSKPNDGLDSITRAATAFLNSEGGLIIWGAPRETTNEILCKHCKPPKELSH